MASSRVRLCARSEGRCNRSGAEQRNDLAPPHSITSFPGREPPPASLVRSWSDSYGTASQQDTQADVRFGSKADMCGAIGHVCFTPESDIKCDVWGCPLR